MMISSSKTLRIFVLVVPFLNIFSNSVVHAQFGVGGNRRAASTNFQDLQELAKEKQKLASPSGAAGGGDIDTDAIQNLWKDAMNNPDYAETMGALGEQFGGALEEMLKLSPEELSAQIEAAMKLMTDGDIVENIVNEKDEVLKSLEASGLVPKEELEKYKADPAYFEQKMRESFEQMGSLLQNPEYISKAAEAMKDMTNLLDNPDGLSDMMKSLMGGVADVPDDTTIEETRVQFLSGEFPPGLKEMFTTPEMQEILQDPIKWRETVKEGFAGLMGGEDNIRDEL